MLAEAEASGESISEELQHNIANIELMTEEKIQQIKNYEKDTVQQFLLSR